MGSKYEKFKDLMSEDDGPLPQKLEWEQMEVGILQKVDELQSTPPFAAAKMRTRTRIGVGVVILLLLLLGVLFFCHRAEKAETPTVLPHQVTVAQDDLPKNRNENAPRRSSPTSANDHVPKLSATKVEPESKTRSTLARNSQLTRLGSTMAVGQSNRTHRQIHRQTEFFGGDPSEPSRVAGSSLVDGEHSPLSEARVSSLMESGAQTLVNEGDGSSTFADQNNLGLRTVVGLLPVKAMTVTQEPGVTILPTHFQKVPVPETSRKQAVGPFRRITFLSGLSWWTMGNGSTKPERHPYEKTILSYQAQLNYLYTSKKNYTLLAGLQLHQLNNRFDWSSMLDDYTVTLTDVVMQVQRNALTGEESEVRGDVEVNVPAMRSVRHFNQTQLYQFSLALGKTWTVKHWQADVLLGGSLNMLSENRGRTLYLGEVRDYDGVNTDFLAPQWNVHGLFMGKLSYQISEHLAISTGLQFQKSLTNWSMEPNVKVRPNVWSWELGVGYLLD